MDRHTGHYGQAHWSLWTGTLVIMDRHTGLHGQAHWSLWTGTLVFMDRHTGLYGDDMMTPTYEFFLKERRRIALE